MYTYQMWTATIRLHLYLLEKGLDQTMVKPGAVEADKEMVVGDVQLDHNGRDLNLGMTNGKDPNLGTTMVNEHQNEKYQNLETMIRKRRQ